jgi:predicted glutamine amidotransferase
VRATTGTAIQQTNCHPFRHGRWLMVHNGVIAGMHEMRRELMLEVNPELFAEIEGSTDSEVLFHLALTYGLERDPVAALERAIGLVEATAARYGIENAVQTSIGITDGERLWAFRYSTEGKSRSLFVSNDASAIRRLHPENPRLQRLRDEDRVVVSEPISDLPGLWQEIPESTVLVVQPGPDEQHAFHPRFEPAAGSARKARMTGVSS